MSVKEKSFKTLEAVERERERVVFREIDITINSDRRKKGESKKRIGYLAEVQKGKKRIKLLQDSLSFL